MMKDSGNKVASDVSMDEAGGGVPAMFIAGAANPFLRCLSVRMGGSEIKPRSKSLRRKVRAAKSFNCPVGVDQFQSLQSSFAR